MATTRGWFIDTWAGEPTDSTASFDRCARLYFLRRQVNQRLQAPMDTPSGRFCYGEAFSPALQPRVAMLSGILKSQGFVRFRRLGEGAEAFALATPNASGGESAVRISSGKVHAAPDDDRLPCDQHFTLLPATNGRAYSVTIAPVVSQNVSEDELWAFKRRQFDRGNICHTDFFLSNLGRYKDRVVLVDYGVSLEPWTDPQLGAWGYAADLLYRVGLKPELASRPYIRDFAAATAAGIYPMRHKDLDALAQGQTALPRRKARLG